MMKRFDAVEWMRKRREEIDEEDGGLTWEERRDKTLKLLHDDPLWKRIEKRVVRSPKKPANTPEESTRIE
jgi:hypothetical protein